jgi:hypothetical protein
MFNKCNCGLTHEISDTQLEKIVDLTVQKITAKFYQEIGKSIFDRFLIIVGAVSLGLYYYFQSKGLIK